MKINCLFIKSCSKGNLAWQSIIEIPLKMAKLLFCPKKRTQVKSWCAIQYTRMYVINLLPVSL